MVHVPTRGDLAPRLGPGVAALPGVAPSAIDRRAYTDPERSERERTHVLARTWLLVCRADRLTAAGDWTTYEGHGETAVIARQPDGTLAAFHNVCRHRGPAIVAELHGCGARRFTCPYHGWVYDTAGRLVGVPDRGDFAPEQLAGLRATPVAVGEIGGWVWINLAGEAAVPLHEWFGAELVAELNCLGMERMTLHAVREWDVAVNYKAIVDGFNELYHVAQLHGIAGDRLRMYRDATYHLCGPHAMCFIPRVEHLDELHRTWDHHAHAVCHYTVFPNTVFNCFPNHLQVFQPIPIDVHRTRFVCWELVQPRAEGDAGYDAYFADTMRHWESLQRTVAEDLALYEQLARTGRSSAAGTHLHSERECKLTHYHAEMDARVGDVVPAVR